MSNLVIAIGGLILMIALILIGVNIGLAMFVSGVVGIIALKGPAVALSLCQTVPFAQSLTYNFTVIPLFTLMGELIFAAGVSGSLYGAAEKWLGRVRGGLAYATIAACSFFAAICGSNVATTATMGTVSYPEMKKYHYKDALAAGTITAGGTLGVLIPPSSIFIIYGIVAQESIGRLFAAGIVPGILLALCYVGAIFIWATVDKELAPRSRHYTIKEKLRSLPGIIPVIVLFLIVLGSIFTGFASAVESAALGALTALIIMICNRKFTLKAFLKCVMNAVKTSCMVLWIIVGAYVFGNFMSLARLPQLLKDTFSTLQVPGPVLVIIMLIIYLVLGCVLDVAPIILITVPIFGPILTQYGYDPIWFGVFIVIVSQIGMMTPPVGVNAYVTCGILKGVKASDVFKGCIPFVAAAFACALIITLFPNLCTFVPNLIYGTY